MAVPRQQRLSLLLVELPAAVSCGHRAVGMAVWTALLDRPSGFLFGHADHGGSHRLRRAARGQTVVAFGAGRAGVFGFQLCLPRRASVPAAHVYGDVRDRGGGVDGRDDCQRGRDGQAAKRPSPAGYATALSRRLYKAVGLCHRCGRVHLLFYSPAKAGGVVGRALCPGDRPHLFVDRLGYQRHVAAEYCYRQHQPIHPRAGDWAVPAMVYAAHRPHGDGAGLRRLSVVFRAAVGIQHLVCGGVGQQRNGGQMGRGGILFCHGRCRQLCSDRPGISSAAAVGGKTRRPSPGGMANGSADSYRPAVPHPGQQNVPHAHRHPRPARHRHCAGQTHRGMDRAANLLLRAARAGNDSLRRFGRGFAARPAAQSGRYCRRHSNRRICRRRANGRL